MADTSTDTDFVAEFDVTHSDDDGWGFDFGYNSPTDHYMAIAINDVWPRPAADSIGGPFVKIKKANGAECLPNLDSTSNCYETLSYLSSITFETSEMTDVPLENELRYPYAVGTDFQPGKMTLIVKNNEARVLLPSPDVDRGTPINSIRQGTRCILTGTFNLPQNYTGGMIGTFTYAHQAIFSNLKITDISDDNYLPSSYCSGDQNARCNAGRAGLCMAVPPPDVCELGDEPVGATKFNTSTLDTFEIIDDPFLCGQCVWVVPENEHISQTSNANRQGTLMGCNAILEPSYTDFIKQVRIDHNDNDGVAFDFGEK